VWWSSFGKPEGGVAGLGDGAKQAPRRPCCAEFRGNVHARLVPLRAASPWIHLGCDLQELCFGHHVESGLEVEEQSAVQPPHINIQNDDVAVKGK